MDQGVDDRTPGWFWADNTLVDTYAARLGIHAFGVYMVMVRHLNGNNECWPSTATIGKKLGISRRTVVTSIQKLVDEGLVTVQAREIPGKGQVSNLYTIRRVDRPTPQVSDEPMQDVHTPMQEMHRGYEPDALPPMQEMHTNKTKGNKTNRTSGGGDARARGNETVMSGDEMDQVIEQMTALFQNPKQAKRLIAAVVKKQGRFTLADVEICRQWLARQTMERPLGKLHLLLDAGQIPTLEPSTPPPLIVNGVRRGPAMSTAPDYDMREAKRRGDEWRKKNAHLLVGLP